MQTLMTGEATSRECLSPPAPSRTVTVPHDSFGVADDDGLACAREPTTTTRRSSAATAVIVRLAAVSQAHPALAGAPTETLASGTLPPGPGVSAGTGARRAYDVSWSRLARITSPHRSAAATVAGCLSSGPSRTGASGDGSSWTSSSSSSVPMSEPLSSRSHTHLRTEPSAYAAVTAARPPPSAWPSPPAALSASTGQSSLTDRT
mmetsp:Transcript_20776/g.35572  ORF Transcript_20776/g.35572 Transcript_20776/m.35572 type:complete len:205 (-) Transcript_20776:684-1298(-)